MATHVVHGLKVGKVNGKYALMLFRVCQNKNGQQCELHEVCGKTICVGEVACIKRELQHDGEEALRAYRLRDGLKTCIFGHIKIKDITERIVSYFNGMLVQVVALDEDELEASQNASLEGVIKVVRIGKKDKPLH